MVDGAALEKRCAKAPRVRIPPSPPTIRELTAHPGVGAPARSLTHRRVRSLSCSTPPWPGLSSLGSKGRSGQASMATSERSPSGLWRRTGNAVRGNPSRVRIPPSPPLPVVGAPTGLDCAGRARRGTSGALYLQSAPAGLNPLPRSPSSNAAGWCDVEDRVPRSGEPRTVSGPEGSSTKRPSPSAAVRPGPSRSSGWARGRSARRRVHGTSNPHAPTRRSA